MLDILGSKNLVVWLVLMGVTVVSWYLSAPTLASPSAMTGIFMIAMAFFKARLVMVHFMEIGKAPLALKLICDTWAVVGCVSVAGLYFCLE